jgi:hypothetical protein
MDAPVSDSVNAWQPFTFGGAAAFALARPSRCFWLSAVVALAWAVAEVWFLTVAYQPVVEEALANLPARGQINDGRLEWGNLTPATLGQRSFLALVVDLEGSGKPGQLADLQCVFGRSQVRFEALLGSLDVGYPHGWIIPFNRTELDPWWGAWRPFILVGIGGLSVLGLFFAWALLATIYALPVRLVAWIWRRPLAGAQAWRLAWAALMPGALGMTLALWMYGLQRLSLVGFLLAFGLHFVLAWIYLLFAPARLPRMAAPETVDHNPFAPPPAKDPEKRSRGSENPFA